MKQTSPQTVTVRDRFRFQADDCNTRHISLCGCGCRVIVNNLFVGKKCRHNRTHTVHIKSCVLHCILEYLQTCVQAGIYRIFIFFNFKHWGRLRYHYRISPKCACLINRTERSNTLHNLFVLRKLQAAFRRRQFFRGL